MSWCYRVMTETSARSPCRGGDGWLWSTTLFPGGCSTTWETPWAQSASIADFTARGNASASLRSYAYALLRWWRWLQVVEMDWDKATSAEVKDFVLWFSWATKQRRAARTASAATAGTVNPITRKRYLDDRYQPRTVRQSNAVLRDFYEF